MSSEALLIFGFFVSFGLFLIGKKLEAMVPYPIRHNVSVLKWLLSIAIFANFIANYFTTTGV